MSSPPAPPSTWAPLRVKLFRSLWVAALVSNIGAWMQTVGAQWLLVRQADAAVLVSLVQTADFLPDVLFGLMGGVLADIFDRRHLLIAVQLSLFTASAIMTTLTLAHHMPPALLLTFTFLLGTGSVVVSPAFQSLIPDLVPREQVPGAAALSSISVNLARAIGPAIAGLLIARTGVGGVFALNSATFLFFAVVAITWHAPPGTTGGPPERFLPALRAGGRYVRYSPVVRRIFVRAALFLVPASALWALLALVASRRLAMGASGYGFLLGALGVGAIVGALSLRTARSKFSTNTLATTATVGYALALVVVVLARSVPVALVVLVPAGMAWTIFLSNVNASLQLFLPAWVRARGLSVYQMVLFGAQGGGAVLWGFVATYSGLVPAFLAAAGLMAAGGLTITLWPFYETAHLDRTTAIYWPEPQLAMSVEPSQGPVAVQVTYTVTPDKEAAFLQAITRLRQARLRSGAVRWTLYRDGQDAQTYVEIFVVASWEEHLRQHTERQTGTDHDFEQAVDVLSEPAARVTHLIAVPLPE